jgi:nicotinate-nucleotide adenylyltransferase
LEEHQLYVYPRPMHDGAELKNHPNVKFIEAPLMELSSTFIRKSIKEGKDIQYMIPAAVYDYIDEMNFYKK